MKQLTIMLSEEIYNSALVNPDKFVNDNNKLKELFAKALWHAQEKSYSIEYVELKRNLRNIIELLEKTIEFLDESCI